MRMGPVLLDTLYDRTPIGADALKMNVWDRVR